jgi:hypothetical protein
VPGAQTALGPAAGGLAGTYLEGDDGLSQRLGFEDTIRNLPCSVQIADDGSERCLPPQGGLRAPGTWYADQGCTIEAAINFDSNCSADSPFVFEFDETMCVSRATLYQRGAAVTSSSAFLKSGASCLPVPQDVFVHGGHLYRIGPKIDVAMFPQLHAAYDTRATSRLEARLDVSDMGIALARNGIWYDSQRMEVCTFVPSPAGMFSCVPNSFAATFYTDMMCKMPVAGYTATPTCHPSDRYLVDAVQTGMCTFDHHVYTLGSTVTPAQLYLESGGQCLQVGGTSATLFLQVMGEVPLSSFVTATPMTE